MPSNRDQADALSYAATVTPSLQAKREAAAARLTSQTEGLFGRISGRRSSRQMEQDAAAVLENLRGNRDRGEPIGQLTEEFLQQASQGTSPEELLQSARESVATHAQHDPEAFAHTVLNARRAGTLSRQEAITLLSVNNFQSLVEARLTLEHSEQAQTAHELDQAQAQQWLIQQLETAGVQQSVLQVPEPEPEPEPESAFNTLTTRRTSPRRLLKKLKTKPRTEKGGQG